MEELAKIREVALPPDSLLHPESRTAVMETTSELAPRDLPARTTARPAAPEVTASSVHLDALRGAAALVVLLGHTRDLFFSSLTGSERYSGTGTVNASSATQSNAGIAEANAGGITIGNEAVIVFFVLSGYLVGGSAIKAVRRNKWSWKSYLAKRMTRLWMVLLPALLFGVLVDYAGVHLFLTHGSIYSGPAEQSLVPDDILRRLTLRVIAGNTVFLQSIFVDPAGSNNSLWSLANEFWYYIAFPLILLAASKRRPLWLRCAYLLGLAAIAALVGKSICMLFPIWALGALISLVPLRLSSQLSSRLALGLAFLLPFGLVFVRRMPMERYLAQWIVAAYFSMLLYLVLNQTERAHAGVYRTVSGFFSRISYTLYLVHLPLAVFFCACINTPWHAWEKTSGNVAVYLALNAVLVLLAYPFYILFEANTDRVRNAIFGNPGVERRAPAAFHVQNP